MSVNFEKLIKKSDKPEKMERIAHMLMESGFNSNAFIGKELLSLPDTIDDNEKIIFSATGLYNGHSVLIVVTDCRLILINKNMIVGSSNSEIPLEKINEVSYKNGMMLGKVTFTNGAISNSIENLEKSVTQQLTDAIRNATNNLKNKNNQPQQSTVNVQTQTQPNNTSMSADKLREMKQLADDGIISNEEFEAAKKKYLGL